MPEWLDDNTIKGEMDEEAFRADVKRQMQERIERETQEGKPHNYGNDGFGIVYEEGYRFHDVRCVLRVLRYFAVSLSRRGEADIDNARLWRREGWKGMNLIGKHVVLEPVEGDGPVLKDTELLWRDSLQYQQEEWTLRQQWEDMERQAEKDCREFANFLLLPDKKE